jgi:hypothetical protein
MGNYIRLFSFAMEDQPMSDKISKFMRENEFMQDYHLGEVYAPLSQVHLTNGERSCPSAEVRKRLTWPDENFIRESGGGAPQPDFLL